jgi:type IV secretory pathway VirJ component
MKIACIAAFLICSVYSVRAIGSEETMSFGRFGDIAVYSESKTPSHVVLLVSGDGGWKKGVVSMAMRLATMDTLVVGIDIVHYMKQLVLSSDGCSYPAADFEALNKFIQKKRNFPEYVTPALMGYSSGATLVYATLVQAPPGTFLGGFSLGFCPDLALKKPLCRGSGLQWVYHPKISTYVFSPSTTLQSKWVVFQGLTDQVCHPDKTEDYVKQVSDASIVLLPKVGHGYAVERNWFPQFAQEYRQFFNQIDASSDKNTRSEKLNDLPLVEVRSKGSSSPLLGVIITGDGGWASLDRQLGEDLAEKGIDIIGFNSL